MRPVPIPDLCFRRFILLLYLKTLFLSRDILSIWRNGWDSNPRDTYVSDSLVDCRFKPLIHRSIYSLIIVLVHRICQVHVARQIWQEDNQLAPSMN